MANDSGVGSSAYDGAPSKKISAIAGAYLILNFMVYPVSEKYHRGYAVRYLRAYASRE